MAYIGEGGVKQLAVLINNRYITADAVDTKISDAVKDIAGFKTEVVASLPTTGVEGTIYFAPSSNAEDGNSYDEFIWIASQTKFEQVGSTKVDLDDYAKTEDLYDPDNKDTLAKLSTSDDGTLLFDGSEIKGGGDTVEVTQTLTSGTEIGSIKVGDETTVLYAPEGSSGSGAGDVYYAYEGYSEEEQVIGEYFGKPLYRKIIKESISSNHTSNASISHNVNNIEKLVSLEGGLISDTGVMIPNVYSTSGWYVTFWAEDLSKIYYKNSGWNSGVLVIVMKYTKTTDPENSFTPSMITDNKTIISAAPTFEDYSTEEKCIGRWIDGKPIYRKVYNTTSPSTSNATEYPLEVSIDTVVAKFGYIMFQGNAMPFNSSWNNNMIISAIVRNNINPIPNSLSVKCGDLTNLPMIFTIEYTKTTDEPNSFKPEMITSGIMADEPASDAEVDEIFN